jgi:hypothetical protein
MTPTQEDPMSEEDLNLIRLSLRIRRAELFNYELQRAVMRSRMR